MRRHVKRFKQRLARIRLFDSLPPGLVASGLFSAHLSSPLRWNDLSHTLIWEVSPLSEASGAHEIKHTSQALPKTAKPTGELPYPVSSPSHARGFPPAPLCTRQAQACLSGTPFPTPPSG